MIEESCTVISQVALKAGYSELNLHSPSIAPVARPGQFVHLAVPGLEGMSLRRPFSIYHAAGEELKILYKSVGRGTAQMSTLRLGANISLIGPLGNGFPLECHGAPLLVAGGYGVAPLYFLAARLATKGQLFVGGRTADDILAVERFKALGWQVIITTEDGSLGERALVTEPLAAAVADLKRSGANATLFACGPDGLLQAVGAMAIKNEMQAWLSLDKRMVCAVGACLACVQKLRHADNSTWLGRVCHDGPIFEARQIVW